MFITVLDPESKRLKIVERLFKIRELTDANGVLTTQLQPNLSVLKILSPNPYYCELVNYDPNSGLIQIKVYKLVRKTIEIPDIVVSQQSLVSNISPSTELVNVIESSTDVSVVSDIGSDAGLWISDSAGNLSHTHSLTKTTVKNITPLPKTIVTNILVETSLVNIVSDKRTLTIVVNDLEPVVNYEIEIYVFGY